MSDENLRHLQVTGKAESILPVEGGRPLTVIGTESIRRGFGEQCLQQAINSATAPGVTRFALNADAHAGYGAPVGCVMVSPTHIYPGPVGVDIKCSMSLLQLELDERAIEDASTRRAVMSAIGDRIPTGPGVGGRDVAQPREIDHELARLVVTRGGCEQASEALGIPACWAQRCEDHAHVGHDGTADALDQRLHRLAEDPDFAPRFDFQMQQLGSYGGGNHFGECEIVRVEDSAKAKDAASNFGLRDGGVAFLSHCGSRGFGNWLADRHFRDLLAHFRTWGIPLPGNDPKLVYAPLGTAHANAYLDDMALGANFATVNHLLLNTLILEAFQEVFPGVRGDLVYFISHNIARSEVIDGKPQWVHRKGATRAYPAGHFSLRGTPYESTGHPILLPGNPQAGSVVMVAEPGAKKTAYSINHGAGRVLGRRAALRQLDQHQVNESFESRGILTNCDDYPVDEAPAAYKDFVEVLRSVELTGLASRVARLEARFVMKDSG